MTGSQKRNATMRARQGATKNLAAYFEAIGLGAEAAKKVADRKLSDAIRDVSNQVHRLLDAA